MKSKFTKFKYQMVESTQKGFQEVLVTFDYKGKPCHYYAFVKEKAKMSKQKYIAEAKKEVETMVKNGQLAKRAKRYLGYELKPSDKLTVTSRLPVNSGRGIKPIKVHRSRAFVPFLVLSIVGAAALTYGVYSLISRFVAFSEFPEYVYTQEELLYYEQMLYMDIALIVAGAVMVAVFVPLLVKYLKRRRKQA